MHSSATNGQQQSTNGVAAAAVLNGVGSATSSMTSTFPSQHHHQQVGPTNIFLSQSGESPANLLSGGGESTNAGEASSQLQVILTVRLLMQGKEVGSIIGKKGDYVKQIREQSGAKINISDGSCPERIVTISGTAGAIDHAFRMIAKKFEDDLQALQSSPIKPPITLRLIVPASQCGSLIGKGGSKIREIRDKTGASLQVASEMLSNSTEKPVTISGSSDALIGCMHEICQILLEAPAKVPTIQYKPVNPVYNPMAVVSSATAIAAAAAAQKKVAAAGLSLGGLGALQPQMSGILGAAAAANPLHASLHELALFQQQQQQRHQHFPSSYVDVSRLLLPATGATTAGHQQQQHYATTAAASALHQNNAALLAAAMNPGLISTSSAQTAAAIGQPQNGLEQLYYGLDPITAALLAQQQNGAAGGNAADYAAAMLAQLQQQQLQQYQQKQLDPAQQQQQFLLQQQQLQMLYQQQQHAPVVTAVDTGTSQLIGGAGRTMGSNGQALKDPSSGSAVGAGGTAGHQQQQTTKRFTPY